MIFLPTFFIQEKKLVVRPGGERNNGLWAGLFRFFS